MPNRRRLSYDGSVHHLYARGSNRRVIFRDNRDYASYLQLLQSAAAKFDIKLFHYALMPNHVHLVARRGKYALGQFMHDIQLKYAKYFCKRHDIVGRVWQGRYKDRLIETDAELLARGSYVERNAERAGLVADPKDWPWCSYRHYAYGEMNVLITETPLYRPLGRNPAARQATYRRLIRRTRADGG